MRGFSHSRNGPILGDMCGSVSLDKKYPYRRNQYKKPIWGARPCGYRGPDADLRRSEVQSAEQIRPLSIRRHWTATKTNRANSGPI